MKKVIIATAILIPIALFFFQGKEKPESKEIAPKAVSRAPVTVSKVSLGPIHKGYTAVGTIAPKEKARIMPRVSGRISSLKVEEGDHVTIKFTLDNSAATQVEKDAIVKSVINTRIGCEFLDSDRGDATLGFYFL